MKKTKPESLVSELQAIQSRLAKTASKSIGTAAQDLVYHAGMTIQKAINELLMNQGAKP